jgi:hypothetical protein
METEKGVMAGEGWDCEVVFPVFTSGRLVPVSV